MNLSKKRIAALISVAAVAAFALILTATPQTASAHGGPGRSGRGGMMQAPRMASPERDNAYMAEALGISEEALEEAHQQAAEAAIDQALAEGLITEAQAEMIQEHGRRMMGIIGKFGRFGGAADIDHEALLADALGISVEALEDARNEAKDAALAQAVEDGRITQERADEMKAMQALREYLQTQGLQESVRSLYDEALQGAVDAGVITQEQADRFLEGRAGFGMRGFGKRGGGMRGFAPGNGGTSTAPTAFSF